MFLNDTGFDAFSIRNVTNISLLVRMLGDLCVADQMAGKRIFSQTAAPLFAKNNAQTPGKEVMISLWAFNHLSWDRPLVPLRWGCDGAIGGNNFGFISVSV